ncbi:hypothetical protein [Actinacidiphila acidipaludis]|uniref:Uncharacterized protein n=1 Tax=Actinacidiphila acidipaludis TaxID=2873382 RepID=A0ABS7PZ44_9ACTN|nr:hypothetical protein [Streptomyces acidipaludis]MBY8876161.1 hypothetical protein [Streptomyces acidipaludis]
MATQEELPPNGPRRPIAAAGTREHPYAHLLPIVEAELACGNRVLSAWGRSDKLLDDRSLTLAQPFHVEDLRRAFRFPANIHLYAILPRPGHPLDKPRMLMTDVDRYVTIHAPLPADWPHGDGRIAL